MSDFVDNFIKTASPDKIALTAYQVQNIKEIYTAVFNNSRQYFVPGDNRCIYLKIYVDGSDIRSNWIFQPAYTSPYMAREVYIDFFNDYERYRFSTLPKVDELQEIIKQDEHIYLLKRININKLIEKRNYNFSSDNTAIETISSKDSIINNFRFPIITLCGSTKFKDDFIKAQKELTLRGNIVISVGLFGHSGDEEAWEGSNKEMLDRMHKEKIRMADAIYVINKDGYIGKSTKSEIEFARSLGKEILYMY